MRTRLLPGPALLLVAVALLLALPAGAGARPADRGGASTSGQGGGDTKSKPPKSDGGDPHDGDGGGDSQPNPPQSDDPGSPGKDAGSGNHDQAPPPAPERTPATEDPHPGPASVPPTPQPAAEPAGVPSAPDGDHAVPAPVPAPAPAPAPWPTPAPGPTTAPATTPAPGPTPAPAGTPAPARAPVHLPTTPAPAAHDPIPAQPATSSVPAAVAAKVDPLLATVADAAAQSDPATPLRVIVLGSGASSALRSAGASGASRLAVVTGASASIAAGDLGALASEKGVAYVMLDAPVLPTGALDAARAATPFVRLDGAQNAWRHGLTGRGVGIAVVDSGVAALPDFGDRRLVRVRMPGQDSIEDGYGHGTFVAGIAAGGTASHPGVAPGATLYAVDVSRPDGVHTSDVIEGLAWVLANHRRLGIRVVTLSLSETIPSSYRTDPLDTVVEELWRQGVVVVASAGNLGPGTAVFAPGNDPRAITVGALDADGAPAAFSTSGTTLDGFAKPDLLAPGRHIVSALPAGTTLASEAPAANVVAPGYAMMSGTSMAAPQVAAAAALLLQQHPRWRPDQVKWVLVRTRSAVAGAPGALAIGRATSFSARPGSANVDLARARFGLAGSTSLPADDATSFDAASWNAASWNAASWNAASWNAASWNAASWNAFVWG